MGADYPRRATSSFSSISRRAWTASGSKSWTGPGTAGNGGLSLHHRTNPSTAGSVRVSSFWTSAFTRPTIWYPGSAPARWFKYLTSSINAAVAFRSFSLASPFRSSSASVRAESRSIVNSCCFLLRSQKYQASGAIIAALTRLTMIAATISTLFHQSLRKGPGSEAFTVAQVTTMEAYSS
jgi:hypothetical protein